MARPSDPEDPKAKPPPDSTIGGKSLDDALEASDFTVLEHGHGPPPTKPLPKELPPRRNVSSEPPKPPKKPVPGSTLGGKTLEKATAPPGPTAPKPPARTPSKGPPPSPDVTPATKGTSSRPRPAAIPPEVAAAQASARFDKFVCVKKLGAGGMGEVWKAWDTQLNRWVALKFLKGGDDEQIARFTREAQLAGQLSHPNIAAIYEVGEAQDRHYIAMQFVDGQTLKTLPRANKKQLVRILRDAARAVHAAHQHGMIHRDIKPENLMVSAVGSDLHLYVMDFGLARPTEGASDVSQQGLIVGTPAFMSPEQARGESLDERADVWSLGATLYELLTDRRPFDGKNVMAILKRVQDDEPAPPRRVNSRLDPDLDTIVLKCLEKDRARRYTSADELADDLTRWLDGEPIKARPAGGLYLLRKRLAKKRGTVIASALGAVGVVIALAIVLPMLRAARKEAATAGRQALDQLRSSTRTALTAGLGFRQMGRLEDMRKQLKEAEIACTKAIAEMPQEAEPHYLLGRLFRARMDDDAALDHQNQAIALDAGFAPARYERVVLNSRRYRRRLRELVDQAWMREGSRLAAEGRGQATASAQLRPPDSQALATADPLAKGIRSDLDRDLADLAKGNQGLEPGEVAAARGLLAWVTRKFDEARKDFEEAMRTSPGLEETYEALAGLDFVVGNYTDAVAWYTKGLERDQGYVPHLAGRAGTRLVIGLVADDRGQDAVPAFASGVEDCSQGLRLDGTRTDLLHLRALIRTTWGATSSSRGKDPSELYKQAMEDIQAVMTAAPGNVEARSLRGDAKLNMGAWHLLAGGDAEAAFADAIADFSEVLRLAPAREEEWSRRGLAYLNRGIIRFRTAGDAVADFRAAITDCSKSIELNPSREESWTSRGMARQSMASALHQRGEDVGPLFRDALADLERAAKCDPSRDRPVMLQGTILGNFALAELRRGGNAAVLFRDALSRCDRALAMNPNRDETWQQRGTVKMNFSNGLPLEEGQRMLLSAIDDFGRSIELNPKRLETRLARADARSNYGVRLESLGGDALAAYEEALRDLEQVLATDAKSPGALSRRGVVRCNAANVRRNRGENATPHYEQAVRDLDQAIALNEGNADSWLERGVIKRRWSEQASMLGQNPVKLLEASITDFDEALKRNPESGDALRNRASSRFNLAIWVGRSGANPTALYREAIADFDRAIEINRADAEALANRCVARFNIGVTRHQEGLDGSDLIRGAEEDASAAIRLAPGVPLNHVFRGDARRCLWVFAADAGQTGEKEYEGAVSDYTEARRINPSLFDAWFNCGTLRMHAGVRTMERDADAATPVFQAAIEEFTRAIALRKDPEALTNRGTCFYNLGLIRDHGGVDAKSDFKGALTDFEEAVRLSPSLRGSLGAYMSDCRVRLKK